jgi:aminodeoxyfutalosine synthase
VTGFSAIDLLEMCHGQLEALGRSAARLREAGLEAVAECPVDRFGSLDAVLAAIRALSAGGLGVPRLTIDHAPADRRLELIERAAAIRDATGFIQAFAPLPRRDSADQPSTGYDDVRTVAVARLVARDIPSIQVDWPLYGPKLAQVALLYGANDVDGIAAIEPPGMGPRRSPAEDIRRQIRAAMGVPVERNGRYEHLS